MTVAVIAEKPAVARDLAGVLKATTRGEGCLRGGGYVVTWAIGHLVGLAGPHHIEERWRRWHLPDLPLIPTNWPLVPLAPTREQFDIVRRILTSSDIDHIVCATDAGREGGLIFRYIYEAAGCSKPVKRLWLSSLTPDAIARGFRDLRAGGAYDALAQSARARSRADWLVGMNFSRLYTVTHDQMFSVGRVQTPTLAMVVARELEIRGFVPEDYLELTATFRVDAPESQAGPDSYRGIYVRPDDSRHRQAARFAPDGRDVDRIASRVEQGTARVESSSRETHRMPATKALRVTELQRHANRLFGMSAQRTLDTAQSLYEKNKLLTYPRTDSRYLSQSVAATLPDVVRTIADPYRDHLAPGTGVKPLGMRFVDDASVTDHHAIIPTTKVAAFESLSLDEQRVYDLVCRRLLSAWHEDYVYATTHVVTAVASRDEEGPSCDRFATSGTSVERLGWKVLDLRSAKADAKANEAPTLPPGLTQGKPVDVAGTKTNARKTRPPERHTDATLLTAMESAGRTVEEQDISEAMKSSGLGTPATRAAIIEVLLRREYLRREGKSLCATDQGIALIGAVDPRVKSPSLTGEWERDLRMIEQGQGNFDAFMQRIEVFVRDVVAQVSNNPGTPTPPQQSEHGRQRALHLTSSDIAAARPVSSSAQPEASAIVPSVRRRGSSLGQLLHEVFGFQTFREHQEDVCKSAEQGRDVLLVMPTGAGKSLCYQLPGIARGGTTLVVSPLIALMEDQVAKLQALGLYAERIHSGRDRASSRAACRSYLAGRLDFLFIAPERLKVPGFIEMLAKRKPTLIAVDEAHCISQWGHDFDRTTACWANVCRFCAPRRSSRSPRQPPPRCRTTSSINSVSPIRPDSFMAFVAPTWPSRCSSEAPVSAPTRRATFFGIPRAARPFSTRRPANTPRRWRANWRRSFRRRRTTLASAARNATRCRALFSAGGSKWWWRLLPLVWASTNRTCAPLSTRHCPLRSRVIIRRLVALDVTENLRAQSCSSRSSTAKCTSFS